MKIKFRKTRRVESCEAKRGVFAHKKNNKVLKKD